VTLLLSAAGLQATPGVAEGHAADAPRVEQERYTEAEIEAARATLAERLRGANDRRARVITIAKIALLERPEGALGVVSEAAFDFEGPSSPHALWRIFEIGDDYARTRVLDLYHEQWNILGKGTDSHRLDMVRRGLASEDRELRYAAARLAATRPIPRVGHTMIDASLGDASLTFAALRAIGANADWRPVRWAIDHLTHPDPRLRDAARFAVQRCGRKSADRIRERLDPDGEEPDPQLLEALLLVATEDDVAVLFRWLDDYGDHHPDLADRITSALARLEIGSYRPEQVAPPELLFFLPEQDGAQSG
jgi:hypothetical protein